MYPTGQSTRILLTDSIETGRGRVKSNGFVTGGTGADLFCQMGMLPSSVDAVPLSSGWKQSAEDILAPARLGHRQQEQRVDRLADLLA